MKIYGQYLNIQSYQLATNCELCQIPVEDNSTGFEQKYSEGTGIGLTQNCRTPSWQNHCSK